MDDTNQQPLTLAGKIGWGLATAAYAAVMGYFIKKEIEDEREDKIRRGEQQQREREVREAMGIIDSALAAFPVDLVKKVQAMEDPDAMVSYELFKSSLDDAIKRLEAHKPYIDGYLLTSLTSTIEMGKRVQEMHL